jgi:hypothetical protein
MIAHDASETHFAKPFCMLSQTDNCFDAKAVKARFSTFETISSVLSNGQNAEWRRFQACQTVFGRF